MTIHDLLPYEESGHIEVYDTYSENVLMTFNSSELNEITIKPEYSSFPNLGENASIYYLSSNISVTICIISDYPEYTVRSYIGSGFEPYSSNVSYVFNNIQPQWDEFVFRITNYDITTKHQLEFQFLIDFSAEIKFVRPPKIYIWLTLLDIIGQNEGLIFLGVVTFSCTMILTARRLLQN